MNPCLKLENVCPLQRNLVIAHTWRYSDVGELSSTKRLFAISDADRDDADDEADDDEDDLWMILSVKDIDSTNSFQLEIKQF